MSDTILVTEVASTDVVYTEGPTETVVTLPEGSANTVVTEQGEVTVVETRIGSTTVIESISQGPQGIPGITSGVTFAREAGVTLSGHRAVYVEDDKVYYASCLEAGHAHRVIGITTGAAIQGSTAIIQGGAELNEPSWSWQADTPIWLGENGVLQQTLPTSGYILQVGFAISATKMYISIREPIFLI